MKSSMRGGRTALSWFPSSFGRLALVVVGTLGAGASCASFDTTREAGPKGTLGDDLYGVFCDRVGASVLPEDINGASYQDICHYDSKGQYGNTVDQSKLPPASGANEKTARTLAIAKLDAMVTHRSDLVRAFNSTFPDETIDDPANPGHQIRMHDALMDFSQRLAPLYSENPYLKGTDALIPASTRALGRLFDALGGHAAPAGNAADPSAPALTAMQQMSGRHGYRPFNVALGAIRPALAYPDLRTLTQASLAVLGPTGVASPELQQLLAVSKQELLSSRPLLATQPPLLIDPSIAQPNRAMSNVEVLSSIMLSGNDAFAASSTDPSRFIARRDVRGFVVPQGSSPGMPGSIQAPFVDKDGDGFADVDDLGRFVDASGAPIAVNTPFDVPDTNQGPSDSYGRPMNAPYDYIDTSRTLLAAVSRDLVPLLDPTVKAQGADAWKQEHETLMYAMAGANVLYGPREAAQYDYAAEEKGSPNPIVDGATTGCPGCFAYTRFRGEESPLADLVHAAGQVLADEDSDALLLGTMDLIQNHEQEVARLIGALLTIRQISAAHDQLALGSNSEPYASLDYEIPIWDEMAQVLARITQRPGLTAKLLASLADPVVVSQQGTSKHEGDTMASFFANRDFLTYDPQSINGPARNVTVGGQSTSDPMTPVDRTQPLVGNNRSIMQRSFQVIHDADHAVLCNKQNAYVETSISAPVVGDISLEWPCGGQCPLFTVAGYDECQLFRIDNASVFYLDTLLPINHPKRSVMPINDQTFLSTILNFASGTGLDVPSILAQSSGIDGLTLDCPNGDAGCPSPQAINRLLFFGADSKQFPNMPDHDQVNDDSSYSAKYQEWMPNSPPNNTNNFVANMVEPASPIVCNVDGTGANACSSVDNLYRVRDFGTMFTWERLGYYNYLGPLVEVFSNESCNADISSCDTTDLSGEQIFVDALEVLWRHWPGDEHGSECDSTGTADTNPRYCSGAGVNKYEPILADAFSSDLIPALHEFAIAATQLSKITVARGKHKGETWTGAEVLEKMTRILFDPKYAASVHMTDRHGNSATTWVDGTPQKQLTPFTLFADALHGIDERFANACSCAGLTGTDATNCQNNVQACTADVQMRQGMWKQARSQLTDEFLSVDGTGSQAAFHNPATPKALVSILQVVREQLNARCPNRENGVDCTWARSDLDTHLGQVMSGPLFAGIMDVQEQIRTNEPARRELEKLLSFILLSASQDDAYQSALASFGDILQIMQDDKRFSPIFNAAASASSPEADQGGPGCATTAINVLEALSSNQYDRHHVLEIMLPNLVTPVQGGGSSPIEVFMDTIADVNRVDAADPAPLDAGDYRAVWTTMHDFMTDDRRGLEQFYTIVKNRPRE